MSIYPMKPSAFTARRNPATGGGGGGGGSIRTIDTYSTTGGSVLSFNLADCQRAIVVWEAISTTTAQPFVLQFSADGGTTGDSSNQYYSFDHFTDNVFFSGYTSHAFTVDTEIEFNQEPSTGNFHGWMEIDNHDAAGPTTWKMVTADFSEGGYIRQSDGFLRTTTAYNALRLAVTGGATFDVVDVVVYRYS